MSIEIMKQALEALEKLTDTEQTYEALDLGDKAITAIKQALAAPVQKPYRPLQDNGSQYFGDSWDTLPTQSAPVQDSTCNETLRAQGKAYPRTCRKCGFGPCIGAKLKEKNNG